MSVAYESVLRLFYFSTPSCVGARGSPAASFPAHDEGVSTRHALPDDLCMIGK
jgi:hypothetical protein